MGSTGVSLTQHQGDPAPGPPSLYTEVFPGPISFILNLLSIYPPAIHRPGITCDGGCSSICLSHNKGPCSRELSSCSTAPTHRAKVSCLLSQAGLQIATQGSFSAGHSSLTTQPALRLYQADYSQAQTPTASAARCCSHSSLRRLGYSFQTLLSLATEES